MNPILTENLKKEMGQRFQVFRQAIGKSRENLALAMGIEPGYIDRIETGEIFPHYDHIYYLCKHYHMNSNWFLTGIGKMIFYGEMKKPFNEVAGYPGKIEELYALLRVPEVREVILARLAELKMIFKSPIKSYFKKEHKAQKNLVFQP